MKKKTREIIVNGKKYLYVINQKYYQEKSEIILKISFEKTKNITCTFRFITWEDAITGSPLLMGVRLKKRDVEEIENFNLHHPSQINKFITNAIDNGWNGESVVEFDGLDIMSQLGFEVLWLKPRNQNN
ncbi:hypothetical protein DFP94_102287 [Fontibacillus phaseoli]|uniref:Uncharacterized protein n=1 Tax=Fontibacillus phaseoli TaxID=1416533 RepID=A0A369BPE0_9BACL|nr:hypothetical protein [Fontibacillus phaseoli]RCX21534.1 hypothetical protein DFP94_102287 [Fontibacillus phaseoli]